jgi:hypothetical protein
MAEVSEITKKAELPVIVEMAEIKKSETLIICL